MKQISSVLERVCLAFARCEVPFVIGGSFACAVMSAPLEVRMLELTIRPRSQNVDHLLTKLASYFEVNNEEFLSAMNCAGEFSLIDAETIVQILVHVSHNEPYDAEVFRRASIVEILPGISSNCMSAEDIVIQKLRWFELGNRVSDRQWNDIVQVLEVQNGLLDEIYLDKWATHFEVNELLEEARSQCLK